MSVLESPTGHTSGRIVSGHRTGPAPLRSLRGRLAALARRRAIFRWTVGVVGTVALMVGLLLTLFVLDWGLEPGRGLRAIFWILAILAGGFVFRRHLWPLFSRVESVEQMALLVEGDQGIDSDLIAALHFESQPEAASGSPQLAGAVVRYVADSTSDLPFDSHISPRPLVRNLGLAAAGVAVLILIATFLPRYWAAFTDRMFAFADVGYPTATELASWSINEVELLGGSDPVSLSVPHSTPLAIEVRATGELPPTGRLLVRGIDSGGETIVTLERVADGSDGGAVYRGELPQIVESLATRVSLGDATTREQTVEMIPGPVVRVRLDPEVPEYARDQLPARDSEEYRLQQNVLEGSDVAFSIESLRKPLREASVTVGETTHPLEPIDDDRRVWTLAETAADESPFESVTEAFHFEVRAIDTDGLPLEQPVRGFVGLTPDRPPQVAGVFQSDRYLPRAKPSLNFQVMDDFGLSELTLRIERDAKLGEPIPTEDSTTEESPEESTDLETNANSNPAPPARTVTVPIPLTDPNAKHPRLEKGRFRVNFTEHLPDLKVGERIRMVLVARDHRGDRTGRVTESPVSVIEIIDRSQLNADLSESDRLSAEKIDTIIQQQLGIGDGK